MVRIESDGKKISFSPKNAAEGIEPVVSKTTEGVEVVTYKNLWRDTDVVYTVKKEMLKEEIILKSKSAETNFEFDMEGANLKKNKNGGFDVEGAKQGFSELSVTLQKAGPTSEKVITQDFRDNVLSINLDKSWLIKQDADQFPVVIDPTWGRTGNVSWNYTAYKSDGYVCSSSVCYMNAGTSLDNYKRWRTFFYVDFNALRGKVLINACMHLQQANRSYLVGYNNNRYYWIAHASAANYNGIDGGAPQTVGLINYTGDIDMTNQLNFEINRGDWGAWWMMWGEEWNGYTWKGFDPDLSFMAYNYSTTPATPAVVTPQNDQTFTDPQVSFQVNPVGDADGDRVQYYFRIATGSDGETGTVINSGDIDSTQWTVPDGVLQDGTTYYLHTYSRDPYGYSAPSAPIKFKIDMRRGKDKTQTADTVGPVEVDLATGNVSTSISSHDTTALGGNLGVSLDYNSPMRSRNGLVAQYWNNTGLSGVPAITRVDKNINFDWNTGSYSSGQSVDYYSAQWTGYFVAPVTGDYQFGGSNDDGMSIFVGSPERSVYGQGCYGNVACYGSAYHMDQGQVVPIRITFAEATGLAYAKLYVRGPVAEQIVPSEWLQTGVRPVSASNGLTGRYYSDDGTHDFNSTNKQLYLSRLDTTISFNWGTGSVVPGAPADNFMVRWNGYLTVPTSGSYQFGTVSDDGSRVTVNNAQVLNKWNDDGGTPVWGSAINLNAGQTVPITADFFEHGGGAAMYLKVKVNGASEQIVPATWLSPSAQVLPAGWNLGIDPDGNLNYDRLIANSSSVTLMDSSGDTHMYTWTGGGYKPPTNEDGQLTRNGDGTYTFIDSDGTTYVFDASGVLTSVTMPTDDRKPAALKYDYSGSPARITKITDGIDELRNAQVYYYGDGQNKCGDTSGFDSEAQLIANNNSYICAVITNDLRVTYFRYTQGFLSRVIRPGNEATDYQYDTLGRIVAIRDSLANDVVTASSVTGRTADDSVLTQINYDSIGRAVSVKAPAATVGAARQQQAFEYKPYATPFVRYIKTVGTVDRWVTTGSPQVNYTPETHISASLLWQQMPGTHAMYSCLVAGWDQMVSPDPNCEGQQKIGFIGYAYDNPQPDGLTVPIRRCVVGTDHFISHSDNCEGQIVESILGYAIAGNTMSGQTLEHISGDVEPNGYTRKVEWDSTFRTVRDTDVTGKATYQQWDPVKDLLLSSTDATGLKTTTIYDANDAPVETFGPAPSAWFGQDRKPIASFWTQVPHTKTAYDEDMTGPAVTYMSLATNSTSSVLGVNGVMRRGDSRVSRDRRFTFIYQTDGNVVLYGPNGAIWNNGKGGVASDQLIMQSDGNLVLYNGSSPVWHTVTGGQGASYLSVQDDGNLVIYKANNQGYTWNTGTYGWLAGTDSAIRYNGAPKLHSTNIVQRSDAVGCYVGISCSNMTGDNWGRIMTGKLKLPIAGNWNFRVWSDGGVRMWIDDNLVIDNLSPSPVQRNHPTYSFGNTVANSYHRFKLEYYHQSGDSNFQLYMTPPGGSETTYVAQYILPDYGLQTSQTVDGAPTSNGATATLVSKTNYGNNPELGLAQSAITDATGLKLTATSTYETQGVSGSYLRQTSSSLAGGATTYYAYYSATETKDNPCTETKEAYRQGGMLRLKTEPDPDGDSSQQGRTVETIYDDTGKIVATRYNDDPWTCTTYDARERVLSTIVPAYNNQSARTITNDYAVGGNPLVTSSSDASGTITVEIDLLGRNVRYVDAKNNITTSEYDSKGHLAKRTSGLGVETYIYDDVDRLTDQKLDGVTFAHVNYDQFSRITSVQYTAGIKLDLTRESTTTGLGRLTKRAYSLASGQIVSDEVTRAVTGDVTGGTELGQVKTYGYDTAGRLTAATVAGNTFTYGYGAQDSSCAALPGTNPDAGSDSNRTFQTVNGTSTTYCYDKADRLIASSSPLYNAPTYDTHGNTTRLGSGDTVTSFTYDSSDRNIGITQSTAAGSITTAYARDVQGRLLYRHQDTNGTNVSDDYYGYTASGDSPDFITDVSGAVTEKYLTLPGDVMVTIRPKKTSAGIQTFSLPNIHGDIFATINADGTLTGTTQTGPFGEVLAASTINTQTPTNTLSNASFTYVGQHEKLSETAYAVAPIQMGARVYIPGLGRFLSVDPELGGTDNNYVYANDPLNDFDLDGTKINFKKIATIASFASVLPGPVGMIAAGVSAAAYAAAGDKKAAAIACAGIALAAVGAGAAVVAVKAAKVATAARAGEGAYGLGKAGKLTASLAGRLYVGRGATKIQQGGRTFLQSADGLRRYGTPITKDSGQKVANFLKKEANTSWSHYNRKIKAGKVSNGHLTVRRWF